MIRLYDLSEYCVILLAVCILPLCSFVKSLVSFVVKYINHKGHKGWHKGTLSKTGI